MIYPSTRARVGSKQKAVGIKRAASGAIAPEPFCFGWPPNHLEELAFQEVEFAT
jgi:hypothetical protein